MDENQCCICLEPLGLPPDAPQDDPSTSSVAGLKGCGHFFHTSCIQRIYNIRGEGGRRCPLCRYKFKVTHNENPLFYLPEKPFQLFQNWLTGSAPAGIVAMHTQAPKRQSALASLEAAELRESLKELTSTVKKQEKKIAKLQQEKATMTNTILQQEAEMQAVQQRHREALKEKDKTLRSAMIDAAIEQETLMAGAKHEIATLNSYRETLERTIQTNAFIAEARQPNESDSWSANFPDIVDTLETTKDLKDLLGSLHRKYQKSRSDVKHWRTVAGEQKHQKEQALSDVRMRVRESEGLIRELESATARGTALKEQLRAAKVLLEAAQAEANNFRVRHGVTCEDLALAKSKLAQAERKAREIMAGAANAKNVPVTPADFWEPVIPPVDTSAKVALSNTGSRTNNPFGALNVTAKTSRTGIKRPAGDMMARFLAPRK
ncbi:hypothetical protein HDU87_000533 [Geranomyces variabilis]|uniref:RING-type domain-containing protein n=1 Tax=Geranomyces variabilis TaxID=109894 RepID=A0AAD5TEH6_9FUNG|nr:hypothetical protein HDU87_000533 [Geranomyces variabilis]